MVGGCFISNHRPSYFLYSFDFFHYRSLFWKYFVKSCLLHLLQFEMLHLQRKLRTWMVWSSRFLVNNDSTHNRGPKLGIYCKHCNYLTQAHLEYLEVQPCKGVANLS